MAKALPQLCPTVSLPRRPAWKALGNTLLSMCIFFTRKLALNKQLSLAGFLSEISLCFEAVLRVSCSTSC